MILRTDDEIQINKWQYLLKHCNFSSPFQTPEYFNFFNSIYGFNANCFAIEEDNEYKSLVVVTIQKEEGVKSYFSRRGIIYGGPIIIGENPDSLQFLLKSINNYYKGKLIYIEIRNYFDYSKWNDSFLNVGFKNIPWLNFHLDIDEPAQMLKKMSSSRSRQIKKALKSGAIWEEAKSIEEVEVFYSILEDLYRNKIKKPIFPKEFFMEFFTQNMGKYLLVYFENKVIGGIMCPILEGKIIYEFYVCGLDTEFKDQYPSVMATWAAMEFASQNNIQTFDFMGAGSPDEAYGVREFKSRFGGTQVEHGRYLNVLNPALYKIGEIGLKVLSKIK